MSFLFGVSMGDIGVNEDVPFVLDRVSGMEQNSKEYHTKPAKNEGEAVGAMGHYHKNVTPQYCPIIQLIAVIFLFIYFAHKSERKYRYKLLEYKFFRTVYFGSKFSEIFI